MGETILEHVRRSRSTGALPWRRSWIRISGGNPRAAESHVAARKRRGVRRSIIRDDEHERIGVRLRSGARAVHSERVDCRGKERHLSDRVTA
jgi:hypothetical protein